MASLAAGNQRVAADYSTGAGYFSSAAAYTIPVQATAWPAVQGTPSVTATSGQQLVFLRGSDNHLWEAWTGPAGWAGPVDWSARLGSAPAGALLASPPSVTITPGGQQLIHWQGADGHLWEAWYTPGTGWSGPVDETPQAPASAAMASAPAVVLSPDARQQLIFWHGVDGHLWESWYTVGLGWNGPRDLTAALGGTAAAVQGGPEVVVTPAGQQLVFWQGADGHLWESWFTIGVGWAGPTDWTRTVSSAGRLASPPTLNLTPAGQQLVFWKGADGHLWESWFTPGYGWSGPTDWSSRLPHAGQLGTQPSVVLTPGGQQLVFWGGPDTHLYEAWFTPNFGWSGATDWTTQLGGRGDIASAPAAAITSSRHQIVFWQGPDGHVWEAEFASAWSGPFDWTAG